MQSTRSKMLWLLVAGILILATGAAWFFLYGNPKTRPVTRAVSMPSSAPSSSSATPSVSQEPEVTIPAEDLDRLRLKFGEVVQASVSVEVRVPGTVQPNAYKQVHVTPLVGGIVTQVAAELGQTVKRGQMLAQLFSGCAPAFCARLPVLRWC